MVLMLVADMVAVALVRRLTPGVFAAYPTGALFWA